MEVLHLYIPNRFYENFDLVMNFLGLAVELFLFKLKDLKN